MKISSLKKSTLTKDNPCFNCGAECCQYIAIDIAEPKDLDDYDAIIWYLLHKGVCVYLDCDKDWYVHIEVPCNFINKDGSCGIYEQRTKICREYTSDECECYGEEDDNFVEFNSVDEFKVFFEHNYSIKGSLVIKKKKVLELP